MASIHKLANGFRVSWYIDHKQFQQYFYGPSAEFCAQEFKEKKDLQYPNKAKKHVTRINRKLTDRSKIVGVHFCENINRTTGNSCPAFIATTSRDRNGIACKKKVTFSIGVHGDQGAYDKACLCRRLYLKCATTEQYGLFWDIYETKEKVVPDNKPFSLPVYSKSL